MKKESQHECLDEKDVLHHLLEEQIAHICVLEEEEQIKNGIIDSGTSLKDIRKN